MRDARVLFLSPVWPRPSGLGVAMRAYRVIEALSARHQISLLTMQPREHAEHDTDSPVLRLCRDVMTLPRRGPIARGLMRMRATLGPLAAPGRRRAPSDWHVPSRAQRRLLAAAYGALDVDLVHVFRLRMLPVLRGLPAHLAATPAQLDIDDLESSTRDRIAAVAHANGDHRVAEAMRHDAEAYRRIEARDLGQFRRVFVTSALDQGQLAHRLPSLRVDIIPNVVSLPAADQPTADRGLEDPFVFLFVGSVSYYPNRDAISFFCREVVPLIRRRTRRAFEIRCVSDRGDAHWRRLPKTRELRRLRPGSDLADAYRESGAVIVPIRAGGGTRIKTLEAFSFRRPVVSTSPGVEGLDVCDGTHALIGDTPREFADRCLAVMDDAALRQRLACAAHELVRTAYGVEAMSRHVHAF